MERSTSSGRPYFDLAPVYLTYRTYLSVFVDRLADEQRHQARLRAACLAAGI